MSLHSTKCHELPEIPRRRFFRDERGTFYEYGHIVLTTIVCTCLSVRLLTIIRRQLGAVTLRVFFREFLSPGADHYWFNIVKTALGSVPFLALVWLLSLCLVCLLLGAMVMSSPEPTRSGPEQQEEQQDID